MKFFQITVVVTKKNCPEITLSLLRLNGEQVNFLPAFYSLTSINDIYKYKKRWLQMISYVLIVELKVKLSC